MISFGYFMFEFSISISIWSPTTNTIYNDTQPNAYPPIGGNSR